MSPTQPMTVPRSAATTGQPSSRDGPLPQRWAIHPWGETVWTYMAMWAPAKLQHLSKQLPAMEAPGSYGPPPNAAVMFHELGTLIAARHDPPPPPGQQPWRTADSTPAPLRLEPDGPTLVKPDPDTSRRPRKPPPEQTLPPLSYIDLPAPHDSRNTVLREWRAVAALVGHVLDLISVIGPVPGPAGRCCRRSSRGCSNPRQDALSGTARAGRARTGPQPATRNRSRLRGAPLALSRAHNRWLFAVAAWHATLKPSATAPTTSPARSCGWRLISTLLDNTRDACVAARRCPPPSQRRQTRCRRSLRRLLLSYTVLLPHW